MNMYNHMLLYIFVMTDSIYIYIYNIFYIFKPNPAAKRSCDPPAVFPALYRAHSAQLPGTSTRCS